MQILKGLLPLLAWTTAVAAVAAPGNGTEWPLHNNGLTKTVEWFVSRFPSKSCFRLSHDVQGSLQFPCQWTKIVCILRRGTKTAIYLSLGLLILYSFITGDILSQNCGGTCSRRLKQQGKYHLFSMKINSTNTLRIASMASLFTITGDTMLQLEIHLISPPEHTISQR